MKGCIVERGYSKIPEVAEFLGISEKAAWQYLSRGEIPYRRWGKRVLVSVAEPEKFIAALPGKSATEAVTTVAVVITLSTRRPARIS